MRRSFMSLLPPVRLTAARPDRCSICLQDMTAGQHAAVLACAHAFHHHCIVTWLSRGRAVCPLCKFEVQL